MRWKIIPTLILSIMGVIFVLGSLVMLGAMIWLNWHFGIEHVANTGNEALRKHALTLSKVGLYLAYVLLGIFNLYIARKWWQQRYRLATILTVIMILLLKAVGPVGPGPNNRKVNLIDKKESQPVGLGSNRLVSKV